MKEKTSHLRTPHQQTDDDKDFGIARDFYITKTFLKYYLY